MKKLILVLSYTWGIIATLLSFIVLIVCKILGYQISRRDGIFVVVSDKPNWGAFSFGIVCVISSTGGKEIILHEMGHCVQNAIFGPLSFLLVYIPSVIRAGYRKLKGLHSGYYDVWFESQATMFGRMIYDK